MKSRRRVLPGAADVGDSGAKDVIGVAAPFLRTLSELSALEALSGAFHHFSRGRLPSTTRQLGQDGESEHARRPDVVLLLSGAPHVAPTKISRDEHACTDRFPLLTPKRSQHAGTTRISLRISDQVACPHQRFTHPAAPVATPPRPSSDRGH